MRPPSKGVFIALPQILQYVWKYIQQDRACTHNAAIMPPTLARTKPPSPRWHLYTEKRVVLRNRVCFYMRSLFLHKLLKEDSYCLQTRQLHRNLLCTLYGPTATHRRRQRQSAHQGRLWCRNGYCKRRDMLKILLLILHTSFLFFVFLLALKLQQH